MKKTILIASFIFPERVEWFLTYLEENFKIQSSHVFVYENLSDPSKLIVTFKLILPEGKRINFKDLFPGAVQVNKCGTAFYTINALNKLIELEMSEPCVNPDYKAVKVDWARYQDQLILTNSDKLMFLPIKRLF